MRSSTSPRSEADLEGLLEVGLTRIPYRIRRSSRAKRKRIVVEPGRVEVVLPDAESTSGAHRFVYAKRRWVFNQTLKLPASEDQGLSYLSGSKVRFRGRWLTLEVKTGRHSTGSVVYRSRFVLTLPKGTARADRPSATKALLDTWMQGKLIEDCRRLARRFAQESRVDLAGMSVTPMKRMWASCGKDRVIRLNPLLVELPRVVLEYVVAHEVTHLRHRNHSPAFWRGVSGLVPDWRERQDWLKSYERDWE